MLVSLNWLRNYVDLGTFNVEELSEKITKSGIEVDGIHHVAEKSEHVVVGYVKSCEQHPNADKLSLCQVDVGDEKLQIICGAENIAAGQKVAVAKPGAVLPGNFKVKKVKLRGIESNGMICSLQELGVNEQYVPDNMDNGIFVFDQEVKIGESVESLLNLDDVILEFDLTPNRSDCLSMLGIAYEVAAILDAPINYPDETLETIEEKASDYVRVHVDDKTLTPYYGAFIIKDVQIKQAPLWMRNYLMAAGIRPINNVVDITNYVLLEYGQPLHAFDYDRLGSNEILVRKATEEETITTLDDQVRTLSKENVVITNGQKPVALAGVMGGANTEVNPETTSTILLESAYFNPLAVRKTAQDTGLHSEASTRFEKGVDPNRVKQAGIRACQLLQKYADGTILNGLSEFDELDRLKEKVPMNRLEINKRLGTNITTEEIEQILTKLQFEYKVTVDDFTVSIPTRRGDITIFEDMLEEVARIYGYDHLPVTLPANSSKPGALSSRQRLKRNIKSFLESAGLMETITYSLTQEEDIHQLVSPEIRLENPEPIKVAMPISEDHKYLRLSILPDLLHVLSYNRARTQQDIAYYELGSIFLSEDKDLTQQPKENLRLAAAITGKWNEHKWQGEKKLVDFFVLKGIVEGLFAHLKLSITFNQAKIDGMHPGRCATVHIGDQVIGFIGQLHPNVAKQRDLKETFVFDLNMESILASFDETPSYNQVPKYPSITRDIAFVVNKNELASDIQSTIEECGVSLIKNVEIFDLYVGDRLDQEKKSIAYRLHFQHPEKTLKDEEVEDAYQQIVKHVNDKHSAYVRMSE